ncbi:DnaD domain protein [Peribacillus frigoritolerans]|nr:DnaD domain protein [Peribacillus frigoritolerans]
MAMWMEDDHQPEIIKSALRESVISGKLNFRYIDRILFRVGKRMELKPWKQAREQGQKI